MTKLASNLMQFHVIREKITIEADYTFDGERCHVCNMPTVVGADPSRRYCSNSKCNALIIQEVV
jgi:NAD-dependent DNA ligase